MPKMVDVKQKMAFFFCPFSVKYNVLSYKELFTFVKHKNAKK